MRCGFHGFGSYIHFLTLEESHDKNSLHVGKGQITKVF